MARSVGEKLRPITGPLYRKRGFSEAHIVTYWTEIVGRDLADHSAPEKLTRPRGKADLGPSTLTIRVDGPAVLELQHLEPQILERINAYYGYRAVGRLKYLQGPLPPRRRRGKKPVRPLTGPEEQALDAELDAIGDTNLRASLRHLGERMLGSKPADGKSSGKSGS